MVYRVSADDLSHVRADPDHNIRPRVLHPVALSDLSKKRIDVPKTVTSIIQFLSIKIQRTKNSRAFVGNKLVRKSSHCLSSIIQRLRHQTVEAHFRSLG
jgi:hypothetical protein